MKSSMSCIVERRHILNLAAVACLGLASLIATSIAGSVQADAGQALYSSLFVDIGPIKATGLGDFANPIGAAVKRGLNKVYSGDINPNNKTLPALVVEVETIYYGQEEEGSISLRMLRNFTHTRDQMSGHAVVKKGTSELKRISVLGNNVTQGGWPPIDDVESGRLQALADQFARAVRYELGD